MIIAYHIIIIILWPSIQSIKFGTSEIEVIKLTQTESRENLYMSWFPEDATFQKSRLSGGARG